MPDVTVPPPGPLGRAALVGRDSARSCLERHLHDAAAGRGSVVVVVGEAGIGKSRLVAEVLASSAADGFRVLTGQCVAIGGEPLRHAALLGIARALAPGGDPAALATDRLLDAVLAAVDGLASPAVLVVEDVHWADRATCEVLMVLAARLVARPVLVVVTARDDELPSGHPVRSFLAELTRLAHVDLITLDRLRAADVAAMIDQLAGPVEARAAAAVAERSGGNPLLVEELCRAGSSSADAGGHRLVDLVLARAERLPAGARSAAVAVAVAGDAVDEDDLDEVLSDAPAGAVRAAVDGHLLVAEDGRIRLRHALVGEALVVGLLRREARELHRRWALVVEGRGSAPARRAHHWRAAGDDRRALPAAIDAAVDAVGVFAVEDAARHFRDAVAMWDAVDDAEELTGWSRTDLWRWAAEATSWAGDPAGAAAVLSDVLDTAETGSVRAALHERRAWYRVRAGEPGADDDYRQALTELPPELPPPERARVLAGCVRLWERAGDAAAARALAVEAVVLADQGAEGDPTAESLRASTRYMLARARLLAGDEAAAAVELERCAAHAEAAGDALVLVNALTDRADLLGGRAQLDAALEELAAIARRLRAGGRGEPHAVLVDGVAAAVRHRLGDPSFGAAAQAVADGARSRITVAVGLALAGRATLDAADGPDAAALASQHLEEARFLAAPVLDARLAAELATARVELFLVRNQLVAARRAVDEALGLVERMPAGEHAAQVALLGLRVAGERARQAAARRSPRADAELHTDVERYEARLRRLTAGRVLRPIDEAVLATAHAERTRIDGTRDPCAWDVAAEAWTRIAWPRRALHARIRATEARLSDPATRAAARTDLVPLAAAADAMGSGLLGAMVRAVAEAAGAPAPTTTIDVRGGPELTRRELEVLELLAAGATNRQIADRLYISAKTASVHVSHILTKLGVTSRDEAAAHARRLR